MPIGASHHEPDGDPLPVREHAALDTGLAPVGGIGPRFSPTQRRLGHGPIHRQPVPLDPLQFVKALDSSSPELEEHACFHPGLEAVMGRGMRAQLRLV
jgi:hypothetical protein